MRNGVHTGSIMNIEVYIQGKEKYQLLCQKVHTENDRIPKIMETKLWEVVHDIIGSFC